MVADGMPSHSACGSDGFEMDDELQQRIWNNPERKRWAARFILVLSLVTALWLGSVPAAFADVQGSDYLGSRTITDRQLTVSDAPDVDAECGILLTSDGRVLWSRNADTPHSIASITKIMTAVVALENLDLSTMVTISDNAASVGESSANLVAGSQLTLETLLHGMLIESGNDAAVAVAEAVAGDEGSFVELMNGKAASLGMTNTHYVDPNGLDDATQSTARDLSILIRYAMRDNTFRSIVSTASESIDLGSGMVTISNTNELLGSYEGAIGVKTGTTDIAGYCLASAVSRDGLELYSVVLGSSQDNTRFTAAEHLFDWGYAHYVPVDLCDTTTTVAEVPHLDWTDKTVAVVCETAQSTHVLDIDGAIHQSVEVTDVHGDVEQGDILGSITWRQGDKVIATARIVAAGDCEAPNLFQRIGVWFERTFGGGPDTAELVLNIPDVTIASDTGSTTGSTTGSASVSSTGSTTGSAAA